jgi:hypothetical protein
LTKARLTDAGHPTGHVMPRTLITVVLTAGFFAPTLGLAPGFGAAAAAPVLVKQQRHAANAVHRTVRFIF